ncbi:hypothetical protein GNP10_14620 [Escherichia coli]|nr:hypothetical protein [Escherichia coli]
MPARSVETATDGTHGADGEERIASVAVLPSAAAPAAQSRQRHAFDKPVGAGRGHSQTRCRATAARQRVALCRGIGRKKCVEHERYVGIST